MTRAVQVVELVNEVSIGAAGVEMHCELNDRKHGYRETSAPKPLPKRCSGA
jgi:hypothetical protein